MGSEWIKQCVEEFGCKRLALIGPTFGDVRDVMFYGESGIANVYPEHNRPRFVPSRSEIQWPNGAKATMISGEEPDSLRGPQYNAVWWDEPARCNKIEELYDGVQFTLRLTMPNGLPPRLLMTTTPKPLEVIRNIIKESEDPDSGVILIHGTTEENIENLDPRSVKKMYASFDGTRTGRQELYAEILMDHDNALWTNESIDNAKRNINNNTENIIDLCRSGHFKRIVMGFDPSGPKSKGNEDLQGLIIAALDYEDEYHILADESCSKSPDGWAIHVENMYHKYNVDKIIVERNGVGALAETVIRTHWRDAPIKNAWAQGAKPARAEPISVIYEKGHVHHYKEFVELEKQMFDMTTDGFKGSGSPDRVDALVWALWELMNGRGSSFNFKVTGRMY